MSPHRGSDIACDDAPRWAQVIVDKIDRLDRHITGGSEPSHGLIVRMDRLERSEESRHKGPSSWWARNSVAAAISAIVGGASAWATAKIQGH